jgi:hypothetical protein
LYVVAKASRRDREKVVGHSTTSSVVIKKHHWWRDPFFITDTKEQELTRISPVANIIMLLFAFLLMLPFLFWLVSLLVFT